MKKLMLAATLMMSLNAMASDLVCFGTEPFFSVGITKDYLSFDLIGEGEKSEKILSTSDALGTSDFAFITKSENMTATVIRGECNDGMSDKVYPRHIVIETGSSVFYGCCMKPEEAKW